MTKKNFIITFVISAGVTFGVFMFAPASKTLYIKNSALYLASADNKIGDLSNTIIPSITVPENITENFAGLLAKAIIDKNNQPKDINSPVEPGLNMPDPNKIAEEFIKNGLQKANENILNIKSPEIKTSPDNSKEAVELYLTEVQKILKDNLKGEPLISILEEINKNNGQGIENLLPIISAHEAVANQIEEKTAPSDLKDLMTEEVRLLQITANVLRALTNIENDPLGAIAATGQFRAIMINWSELQRKFNVFTEKLNKT